MAELQHVVAIVDKRPFFEKALAHGVNAHIIDRVRCDAIIADGAKGSVQVAEHFGTSFLQADLENARKRIVNLVSLYLEDGTGGDLRQAALSLQQNSFLSHSRGGNEMIKALHAMPETSMSGDIKSQTLLDFQNERTLVKPFTLASYRKERKRRMDVAAIIAAAHWFCSDLDITRTSLDFVALEAVIRSAILVRHGGADKAPNHGEFAKLISAARDGVAAGQKLRIAKTLLDDVPEPHRAIAEAIRKDIEKQDGPLIANPARKLEEVLHLIESRYFLRDTDFDDIDSFAGFVSEAWRVATKGKDDPYSRLTLFMCLATGNKAKTAVTEAEARSMIRHVRKHGFDNAAVSTFIAESAPFELKEDLQALWDDEFLPEAKERLLDDSDASLQRALMYLTDNLNVKIRRETNKSA